MPSAQQSSELSSNAPPGSDPNHPMVYQIRVKSHLDSDWADWFEGLTVTLEATGHTLLTGPVVDQAALYGLLKKIRDLGMLLISVNSFEPAASTTFGNGQIGKAEDQP